MADHNSDGGEGAVQQEANSGQNKRSRGISWLTGVFAVVSLITGMIGHWRSWPVMFCFIPVTLVLCGVTIYEHFPKRNGDDNAFLLAVVLPLVVAAGIGFAYLATWPVPTPEARFSFRIGVTPRYEDSLLLTNDSLYHEGGVFRTNDVMYAVGIPVTTMTNHLPPVQLQFWVAPPAYAEALEVKLILPGNLRCELGPEWSRSSGITTPKWSGKGVSVQGYTYQFSRLVHSNEFINLPEILVMDPPGNSHELDSSFCALTAVAKDTPQSVISFFINFVPLNRLNYLVPELRQIRPDGSFEFDFPFQYGTNWKQ
jgi:hypothetical protein